MENYRDIKLDVGCGWRKENGYVGLDIRDIEGVDIVHDVCEFPWPLPYNCCTEIRMVLVWCCIEPKYRIKFMDELWRIAKPGCVVSIKAVHTMSQYLPHDPIYYTGANEMTFCYFDPSHPKYKTYKPKPWKIVFYESNYTTIVEVRMEPRK